MMSPDLSSYNFLVILFVWHTTPFLVWHSPLYQHHVILPWALVILKYSLSCVLLYRLSPLPRTSFLTLYLNKCVSLPPHRVSSLRVEPRVPFLYLQSDRVRHTQCELNTFVWLLSAINSCIHHQQKIPFNVYWLWSFHEILECLSCGIPKYDLVGTSMASALMEGIGGWMRERGDKTQRSSVKLSNFKGTLPEKIPKFSQATLFSIFYQNFIKFVIYFMR